MSIKLGSKSIMDIYLGDKKIDKIYLGDKLVYQSSNEDDDSENNIFYLTVFQLVDESSDYIYIEYNGKYKIEGGKGFKYNETSKEWIVDTGFAADYLLKIYNGPYDEYILLYSSTHYVTDRVYVRKSHSPIDSSLLDPYNPNLP